MKETENPGYEGKKHDVLRVRTPEEAKSYKIEYSRPRTRWTPDELAKRFPGDKKQESMFIADNGEMQRIFRFVKTADNEGNYTGEEYAHEVSRIAYDPLVARSSLFAIVWRDESHYDSQGYLTYYASVVSNTYQALPLGQRDSYEQRYEYRVLPNGKKELARVIEQAITKTIDLRPGSRTGEPYIVDFTNIPLE